MKLGNITEAVDIASQNEEEKEQNITKVGIPRFSTFFRAVDGIKNIIEKKDETEKKEQENLLEQAKAEKYENWAREDEIRKEVEEREDNAYQRAVEDMIKAGINPAIFGVSPASSGGGLTSATKSDYSIATEMLNEAFESKENSKDRAVKVITAIFAILGLLIKGGKK